MIYQFKSGFRTDGLNAQAVGEELERIRSVNGGKLETEMVVIEAGEANSPLHPAFTWDNDTAAHRWRLAEAQKLIRHVIIVDEVNEEETKAFYTIKIANPESGEVEQYYQSASVVARDSNEYASALRTILGDLQGAERSLNQLQNLASKTDRLAVRKASTYVMEAHRVLAVTQALNT